MGDGFHRSKDPTNSIKVLKEMLQRIKANNENNYIHIWRYNNIHKNIHKINTTSPLVYTTMG